MTNHEAMLSNVHGDWIFVVGAITVIALVIQHYILKKKNSEDIDENYRLFQVPTDRSLIHRDDDTGYLYKSSIPCSKRSIIVPTTPIHLHICAREKVKCGDAVLNPRTLRLSKVWTQAEETYYASWLVVKASTDPFIAAPTVSMDFIDLYVREQGRIDYESLI